MPQASDTMVLHWTTDFMFLVEGWHVTSYLAFGGTALLVFAVAIFYRWLHRLYNRCIKALKPEKMSEPLLLNPSYDDDPKQCVTPSFSVFPSPPPLIHLFFFFLVSLLLTDPQFGEGGCCGLNKGGHTAVLLSRVVPTLLLMILYVLDIFQMIVIMTFNVGLLAALLLGAGLGYLVFGSE